MPRRGHIRARSWWAQRGRLACSTLKCGANLAKKRKHERRENRRRGGRGEDAEAKKTTNTRVPSPRARPFTVIVPSSTPKVLRPANVSSSDVFPAPLSPRRARTVPGSATPLTSLSLNDPTSVDATAHSPPTAFSRLQRAAVAELQMTRQALPRERHWHHLRLDAREALAQLVAANKDGQYTRNQHERGSHTCGN